MPEVPELLTLRHNLLTRFKNRKITYFEIKWDKKLKSPKQDIVSAVKGATLTGIERSGKTLELHLNNDQKLGFHLMQAGRPYLRPSDNEIKWPVWEMFFENGMGFGIQDPTLQTSLALNPITPNVPDVLTESLTVEYLKAIFKKSCEQLIKPLLTNPRYIRGLGNAYVDEILWQIKVSPASIASLIPEEKIHELHGAIEAVLTNAEIEIRKITGSDALMIEKRDFMNVHNSKRTKDPYGDEIHKGEVGKAKTYWTKSQVLYEHKHQVFGKSL
ncbi:DNA-formamidopyrimidine glycosylase family protein [Dyadobacter fanqingshengii]|uniref:Formamidopyrimidine-DNA glycosylase catalytic domain-containing protein n=1 Tax=Dyadobacter fanqingshengii TaxID=2906443 RepID=A0A9X1PFS1_9BACT|nr:DNA-formamidopyrimidine glycosylase family protein [Dyadobacter fanqingshengii]MCF0043645.1 hypothetical protein [Dyadobacter fanqingshengii]USJ34739.1 hypothetical protein NFI81_18750 [Dyadobacter fanqingshengii]